MMRCCPCSAGDPCADLTRVVEPELSPDAPEIGCTSDDDSRRGKSASKKEQTENLSLPTQLRACEEYCRRQGYEVLERFHEEGESAKSTDRSQLQSLRRLNKGRVHFVVVFNLTRFARDKYDHFALRSLLQLLGISLRSATEPIDDTSTGKLKEVVLAAFARFDNDVRSDRTRGHAEERHRQCRFANATPDPALRYRSNARALRSSAKSIVTSSCQGPPPAVCAQRPALCAARRRTASAVTPV
jgi:DNA invertase Pin-like site-specific DNA recombinase